MRTRAGGHLLMGRLFREAWYAMVQRPTRLLLTALGVAVGIGSLVATIGLSATASAQIGSEFNALLATQVGVGATSGSGSFPAGAAARVDQLPGVVASAVWCTIDASAAITVSRVSSQQGQATAQLVAADTGFGEADDLSVTGTLLGPQFRTDLVADVGIGAMRQLGLSQEDLPATVIVAGRVVTVVGIITAAPVAPALLASVVVPLDAAQQAWHTSSMADQQMVIRIREGAAQAVAGEAPAAVDPVYPDQFTATAPPDPAEFRNQVQGSVQVLFIALAVVALVVSAFGIANTTLVSVMERRGEIGLRRAVGAQRRHIALQFVLESGLTGLTGGAIGTCIGIMIVMGVSMAKTWTATMPAGLVSVAPLIGMGIGIVAGLHPALRAASVQPVEALRSQ
jgi:putative ABC transport system permease protein